MVYIETMRRKEKVTLWVVGTETTSTARKKVVTPVQIKVRWTEKESEALSPDGEKIRLDVTAVVAQAVPVGSIMARCEKADYDGTQDLYEVVVNPQTHNLKQTRKRRVAGLIRYSGSLPPIES
jgi:hypothetical protein